MWLLSSRRDGIAPPPVSVVAGLFGVLRERRGDLISPARTDIKTHRR